MPNVWRDPATLHELEQMTVHGGEGDSERTFWFFRPTGSEANDYSSLTVYEQVPCVIAHHYGNNPLEDPGGLYFQFASEDEEDHSHIRYVDQEDVYNSIIEVLVSQFPNGLRGIE